MHRPTSRLRRVVAVVLLAIGLVAGGVVTGSAVPVGAGPATGSVGGTVTHTATGLPVEGASVTLYNAAGNPAGVVTTGPTGTYLHEAVSDGDYVVGVSAAGYFPGFNGGASSREAATPVTVASDAVGVDVALVAKGSLVGRITGADCGCPVPGVQVKIFDAADQVVASVAPGASGRYSKALPSGGYRLKVAAPGHVPAYSGGAATLAEASVVTVPQGNVTFDVALARVAATGAFTGTVTDVCGCRLVGAKVSFFQPDGTLVDTATANAAGRYSKTLPNGEYKVKFGATGYFSTYGGGAWTLPEADVFTLDGTTEVIDAALVPRSALVGRLVGDITGADCSCILPGARIGVYDPSGYLFTRVAPAADGSYSIVVPNGDYVVGFTAPGYQPSFSGGVDTFDEAEVLEVGGSAVREDVALQRTPTHGAVVGTVTGEDCGCRLREVSATFYDLSGIEVARATSALGDYVRSLPNGQYRVRLSAPGYVPVFNGGAATLAEAAVVTVSGDTVRVDAELTRVAPTGRIVGSVDDMCGCPVWGASAKFYDQDGRQVATTMINESGNYSKVLPNGQYRVKFVAPGYVSAFSGGASALAEAEIVTVAGDAVRVDARLLLRSALAGRVYDADSGDTLAGATISVYDDNDVLVATATTDDDGDYRIDPLPEGWYRISFEAPGYGTYWAGWGGQDLATAEPVPVFGSVSYWGADLTAVV